MAYNKGMITGRVFKNWFPEAGPGLLVTLQWLRLGDTQFKILNPSTNEVELQPQVYTTEGGYFMVPFLWYPEHVGTIDQPLRYKITVSYPDSNNEYQSETTKGNVGLYVDFGKIWKGMGGMSPAENLPDVINNWTDVYSTIREIPVPQILKQTGFMSTEAYGLFGHAVLSIP